MKSLLKLLGLAIVIVTMIYNINISGTADNKHVSLAYVRNVAQAQAESPAGYDSRSELTGHSTVTHVNSDGSQCTEDFDFDKVVCTGKGSVNCIPSFSQSNVQYQGICPFF